MTFNQTVWDALVFLRHGWEKMADEALEAYAAQCDGKVQWECSHATNGKYVVRFVPNPIPKY